MVATTLQDNRSTISSALIATSNHLGLSHIPSTGALMRLSARNTNRHGEIIALNEGAALFHESRTGDQGSQRLPFCARRVDMRLPPCLPEASGDLTGWQLGTFIELPALKHAISAARSHARRTLREWGLASLSHNVELLVSELVSNAVRASNSRFHEVVRLWLICDHTRVVALVWDASRRVPVRANVSDTAESGRGLLLVEAVSERWGWYFTQAPDGAPRARAGKVVWGVVSQ